MGDKSTFEFAKEHFVHGLQALENQDLVQAAESFEKSLSYLPDRPSTLINLQAVYLKLKRFDKAWDLTERVLRLEPNSAEAYLNAGIILKERAEWLVAQAYFDRAIALDSRNETAWNNRGALALQNRRYTDAEHDFKQALVLNPNNADAYNNLGNLYVSLKDYQRAEASFKKSVAICPRPDVYVNLGNLYSAEYKDYEHAITCYEEALRGPGLVDWLLGSYLLSKARICEWDDFAETKAKALKQLEANEPAIGPFDSLCVFSSSKTHKKSAELYVQRKFAVFKMQRPKYGHKKIRIGYLSSDFGNHAVCHLMAGVIRCHNADSFELHGFDIGVDDGSEMRNKILSDFKYFHVLSTMSDQQAADFIRGQEIDILIDLNGHSRWSRTEILAHKPAPVQVNYLGFPGTMGASDFMDYIIADKMLIPTQVEAHYSEKIIYMPDSFQANDSERLIGECRARSSFGLNNASFVFGCFSHAGKMNPKTFEVWCSILRRVPHSVLWLINENPKQVANLREFARELGVGLDRLVFSESLPYSEHLARYQLVDLVLDTMPFNGGTTTSDALWGGAPVLTCLGESFSGRMSASLLHALELPELIAYSVQQYEDMAVDLATNQQGIAAIRKRLAQNRFTSPLFDTGRFTKNLESAYKAIVARHEAGLGPEHIFI